MSNGRPGERQSEKNKQDTSCDFFHKITLKPFLAGFYTAQQQLSVASCWNCWNSIAVMFDLRWSLVLVGNTETGLFLLIFG